MTVDREVLTARLRRAERRMDQAETDGEYEAARQLYIVARYDLERALDRRAA